MKVIAASPKGGDRLINKVKDSAEDNLNRYFNQNIGGFEFPLLENGDSSSRRFAASLLVKPSEYFNSVIMRDSFPDYKSSDAKATPSLPFVPLLYSNDDVNTFKEIISKPEVLNKEFNIVSKLIENMQIYQKNQKVEDLRYPKVPSLENLSDDKKLQLLSANPGLKSYANYNDVRIEDSKIFNLIPPLLNKFLFEGLGQNKMHKWHLMDHTRNVMLNLQVLMNNGDSNLINELKSEAPSLNGIIQSLNLDSETIENSYIAAFFHDLGKNSDFFHLNAQGLSKEAALMDSFDYLKYFLDRVDGANGFSKERKIDIVKILTAKEIMTGRTSWLDHLNDQGLAKIQSVISTDKNILKPALMLGIADIISHKGDTKWILYKPELKALNENQHMNQGLIDKNQGKRRIDFLLDSYKRFSSPVNDKRKEHKLNSKSFEDNYRALYNLMLNHAKKEPKYLL